MKQNVVLTITSLLSILFMTFHLTDDIVRGMEPGTLSNLIALPILVVWLYGTLVLAGKRSGYVIILLRSLLGLVVPVIHMKGAGVGGAIVFAGSASDPVAPRASGSPEGRSATYVFRDAYSR